MPVLTMILFVGLRLTISSRFAQIRLLPRALRNFWKSLKERNSNQDGMSGFRALCTALAATVGTGNIAGVAGAITIGGPGVVFWMWICAFLGMITKMAEVTLATKYRRKNIVGEYVGGPMYMITEGMPRKYHCLASFYAFFGIVACFGVGNATQVNAVVDGVKSISEMIGKPFGNMELIYVGIVIAVMVSVAFKRGINGVGSWAETLVPIAASAYIVLSLIILIMRVKEVPNAFAAIITGAFRPKSVTCGVITSFFTCIRVGVSRGVFTNEAGMGTASIAHASAHAKHPTQQGLMGIVEVFLDTIVICTLTALVILCSGVEIHYGTDPGITLTLDAFARIYGNWIRIILTLLTCIFAFATILGWGIYGARCAQFLFGDKAWKYFTKFQSIGVILGVLLQTSSVWALAEIVNGLMALPNLIALLFLSPEFYRILSNYHKENAHSF